MAKPLLSQGQIRVRALVCDPVPEFHYDLTPEIRAECLIDEDSGVTSIAIQRDHSGAILALYVSDNDYDYWQVSVTPTYAADVSRNYNTEERTWRTSTAS